MIVSVAKIATYIPRWKQGVEINLTDKYVNILIFRGNFVANDDELTWNEACDVQ